MDSTILHTPYTICLRCAYIFGCHVRLGRDSRPATNKKNEEKYERPIVPNNIHNHNKYPKWYFSSFSLALTLAFAGVYSLYICSVRCAFILLFSLFLKIRVPSGDLLSQFTIFRSRTAGEYRPCSMQCITRTLYMSTADEIRTDHERVSEWEWRDYWAVCEVF